MKVIETKENDAGVLVVKENDTHREYDIFTYAWKWRWWKTYYWDKVASILSWTAIVTLEIDGSDTEITLTPESWEFLIPAWIANIFYFPEDTKMTETFKKGTKTEKFERYREWKK